MYLGRTEENSENFEHNSFFRVRYSNHILLEHVDSKHVTYGLAATLTSRAVVTALYGMFVMTAEIARCAFERTRGVKHFC